MVFRFMSQSGWWWFRNGKGDIQDEDGIPFRSHLPHPDHPIKACYLHLGLIYKRSATYAIQQQYSTIWAGVVVDTVGGFVHFKGN